MIGVVYVIKLRKTIKIGVSLLLSVAILLCSGIVVYADEPTETDSGGTATRGNYSTMAGNMLKNFADGGEGSLTIDKISTTEFRAWGVLVSNYVIPFYTNPTDITKDLDLKDSSGEKKFNVWKHLCKIWQKSGKDEAPDSSLLAQLRQKYQACFATDKMQKIYLDSSDESSNESSNKVAKVSDLITNDSIIKGGNMLYWKDGSSKKYIFNMSTYNDKAVCALVRSVNCKTALDEDMLGKDLFISCFGDICASKGGNDVTVIIPACLNPYSFGKDGSKFMMNNMFVLGNFLSRDNITTDIKSNDKGKLFDSDGKVTDHATCTGKETTTYGSYFYGRKIGADSWLSIFLHISSDSMVPYLQRGRGGIKVDNSDDDVFLAGLSRYHPKDGCRDTDLAQGVDSYLAFTQPLWSIATLKYIADETNYKNVIGLTGRSKLVDSDKIFYNNNEKGIFTRSSELASNISSLNSTLFTYNYTKEGNIFGLSATDSIYHPKLNDKYGVDGSYFQAQIGGFGVAKDTNGKIKVSYKDNGVDKEKQIHGSINDYTSLFNEVDKNSNNEARYVTMFLAGQYADGAVDGTGQGFTDNSIKSLDRLTCFQIPVDKTISKLGIFNTIANSDTANFKTIKAINYTDVGEGSQLKKYHSTAIKYVSSGNNAAANGDNNNAIAMPESLYALNCQDLKSSNAVKLSDGGLYLASDRNLFANIYWAYIEDIVGITAEDIEKAIANGSEVKAQKIPTDLPPVPDSSDFASDLEAQLSSSEVADEVAEAANSELEKKQASIIDWTYKILSGGTSGALADAGQYVISWLKSLVDGLFLGMHNAMVGIDVTNGLTGTVKGIGNTNQSGVYSTAVGYITTPTFDSLPITSWVTNNFTIMYVALMLLVVVILIFMVVSKARRIPQAVGVFIVMAFVLVLPANLLNNSINISNMAAEKIYSEKFMYWAVMQHAEYLVNQGKADNVDQQILADNMSRQAEATKTGGVTVKWLCPKKWGITEQIKSVTKNTKGLGLFLYFAGDILDGEDYSYNISSDGTYLYRSYTAIFVEAKGLQKSLDETNKNYSDKLSAISPKIRAEWNGSNKAKYGAVTLTKSDGKSGSYTLANKTTENGSVKTVTPDTNLFRFKTIRGDTFFRAALGQNSIDKDGKSKVYPDGYYDSYYGSNGIMKVKNNTFKSNNRIYSMYLDSNLTSAVFNFNVNNVSWNPITKAKKCGLWISDDNRVAVDEEVDANIYKEGVRTFLDYSESPYYYFYNVFSDTTIKTDNNDTISGADDFVTLLLSDEFFTVTDQKSKAYGEVKDYLDLEGLFTYIIPFLDYANQDAAKYFQKWGYDVKRTDIEETSETSKKETSKQESSKKETSKPESSKPESSTGETSEEVEEEAPKTQAELDYEEHKSQNQAVWNLYSPWVNALMDANNKAQTANSGYGQVTILEACNPADYTYNNRPMAYSPAEKQLRGYADIDLTTVEYKLQKVLKETREDLIELLNYKDLTGEGVPEGNDILISAAAMIATFHFNQEFSDTGFMSTNIQMYPVSFELKNMNYDAYLRLIMGNSMGVNQVKLMKNKSTANQTIYETFVHNTSAVSAIILILVDAMGVFVIPIMKILLIAIIFFLALALSISCIINAPEKLLPTIINTFVLPVLGMISIFTMHAIVVSWFIGDGASGVIDSHSIAITTGDPTITLLLLLIVDVVTSILMWKLLKYAAVSTVKYIKATFSGIKDMATNLFGNIVGSIGAVAGVGTLAVGTAGLVGKAAAATAKVGAGVVKAGVGHHRAKVQKEIAKNTRNNGNGQGNRTENGQGNGNGQGQGQAQGQGQGQGQAQGQGSGQNNNSSGNNSTVPSGNNSNGDNNSNGNSTNAKMSSENKQQMELKKTNETLKEISGKLDRVSFSRSVGGSPANPMTGSPFKADLENAQKTESGIYVSNNSGKNGTTNTEPKKTKINSASPARAAQNYGNSSTSSNFDFGFGNKEPSGNSVKPVKLFGADGKPLL